MTVKIAKKLIEVALPLEAINEEGSRRKRKAPAGYPTTLHKWWAQRPVAAARAIVFAQMVDDPSEYVDTLLSVPETKRAAERELRKRKQLWEKRKEAFEAQQELNVPEPGQEPTLSECAADIERLRLFEIMQDLVKWENTTNEYVLARARDEILQSWRRVCAANADHPQARTLFRRSELPVFYDPFGGSGAIPLEAQRLGLDARSSDLNPVAVLINKAMIEIAPKFADASPVNPARDPNRSWRRSQGLANDLRFYGELVLATAKERTARLYPDVTITEDLATDRPDLTNLVGRTLPVVAWLWVRTVKSPNPAFNDVDVPLASTFLLSAKSGREAYVEPLVEESSYRFAVRVGKPADPASVGAGTKLGRGANFKCVMSGSPIDGDYIKREGQEGRMGARLFAIVADGERGRVFLPPTPEHEEAALAARADWRPEVTISGSTQYLGIKPYGMTQVDQLFTERQLTALNTFCGLIADLRPRVLADTLSAQTSDSLAPTHAEEYATAVCTYLAFAVSRLADYGSSLATWRPKDNAMRSSTPKQALQMSWDFAEGSPFGNSSSGFAACVDVISKVVETALATGKGSAFQASAQTVEDGLTGSALICTDPPYYDNVPYADLSDFFYVWLRRALAGSYPDLFATVATPKAEELVAFSYRHESKAEAERFFLDGMTEAMRRLALLGHPAFPIAIYYAFKQSEGDEETGEASTGWETFLEAVIRAGFTITGTWPVRTEGDNRQRGIGANALASSIVLVCHPRPAEAPQTTRRHFLTELKSELPTALAKLQRGNIAPVDLAQASIGPGMAVFTRYSRVVDADGRQLSVRDALALINDVLDEVLSEQEGDFDADSRWALSWFDQFGFEPGPYGVAEVLSKAKVTSVGGLVEAGIVTARSSAVRLLKPAELPGDWKPEEDQRLTIWEMTHHLVRALEAGGESAAGSLAVGLGGRAEVARELAYRLYRICELKKRSSEAQSYDGLVKSWPEITRLARDLAAQVRDAPPTDLFEG